MDVVHKSSDSECYIPSSECSDSRITLLHEVGDFCISILFLVKFWVRYFSVEVMSCLVHVKSSVFQDSEAQRVDTRALVFVFI
jgi:hypothetical protein